ncbi:MAG TPA: demethoxyubiquinone hydroxylase family protein [Thermoanaerobaculia bacterium]|nr:demethoxyubiquinone hydroxylase family protein [Thermoanaerobaculia bacterium]
MASPPAASSLTATNPLDAATARRRLIRQLQGAYSGELAAGFAYRGHWKSVRDASERDRIRRIEEEEWHHRALVRELLHTLDAKPNPLREAIFWTIGRVLGLACHVTGWFLPMYGAGKLERGNIVEYEEAALFAAACGQQAMIECILDMAEVEWEHELYFRERIMGHSLLRLFKLWDAPPVKTTIRERFELAAAVTPARETDGDR